MLILALDRDVDLNTRRAGTHDAERPFEHHRSLRSRLCPTGAGAGNTMKHVASEFPALRG